MLLRSPFSRLLVPRIFSYLRRVILTGATFLVSGFLITGCTQDSSTDIVQKEWTPEGERNGLECMDQSDNDYDGLRDCEDPDCDGLLGCADGLATDTAHVGATDGCGDVTEWDVTIVGGVINADDMTPIPNAEVWLEDRAWFCCPITVLGSSTSDEWGNVSLDVGPVASIDGCWGTFLNFVLVAQKDGFYGEKPFNSYLHTAIDTGTLVADFSVFPVGMSEKQDDK